jgi:hypothetical protein
MYMKKSIAATIISSLALAFLATAEPQPSPSPAKKRTVWVPPPMGSLIGGGFTEAGDTPGASQAAASNRRSENPSLAKALAELDSQAGTFVQGYSLIAEAVALQTQLPAAKIKAQRSATGMGFGDLLVANSLAKGSGKSFNEILSMKAKSGTWDLLATKLSIDMNSVVARARAAAQSIRYAESRNNRNRDENKRDNSLVIRSAHGMPSQGSP